eukprot:m.23035 g.23035  ORF g.23035 m.23035 type:complete len:232 (-) comp34562_c0_seq1:78-773(-)
MIPTLADPFDDAKLDDLSTLDYETTPEGSPIWDIQDPHDDPLFDEVLIHTQPDADFDVFDVDDFMLSRNETLETLFSSEDASSYSSASDDEDDDDDDSIDTKLFAEAPRSRPVKRKADADAPTGKRGKKAPGKPRVPRAAGQSVRLPRDGSSEEAKRRVHNMSERNRRGNMKNQYHALRECIPELAGNDRPSNRTILSKAVDCIMELQRQEREFEQQLNMLREENRRLLRK